MIYIIHGPQGCGKTRNAEAFAKMLNARHILEFDMCSSSPDEHMRDGTLVLCNLRELPASMLSEALVMSFDVAMDMLSAESTHA